MSARFCLLLLILFVTWSRGLLLGVLPNLADQARVLSDGLAQQPLLQNAGQAVTNIAASTVNLFAEPTIQLTRMLGIANPPTLVNEHNVVDMTNDIVAEFKIASQNEDVNLNITELITKYGFDVEEHETITPDGYVLKLFRIPGNGSAVFLMHGLLCSADDYVVAGEAHGLAYMLARDGYDVWLGNARGNKHSRNHVSMVPSEAHFWNFSWHEIGILDLPTMIDYVLDETGQSKVKYIGHSQGTTSFFVMASERAEYNDKISLMIALSPVAFMKHVKSPLVRLAAPGVPVLQNVLKTAGFYEFLPSNSLIKSLSNIICGLGPLSDILCSNILFLFTGYGLDQLDVKNLPVVLGHVPSGASWKQFAHYGQLVVSGAFRQFDYGLSENQGRYGSDTPPDYHLSKITAPVSLFYSDGDWLAEPRDVDTLYNKLPNCIDIHKVPHKQFSHMDFIIAKDFDVLIYERLQKLLERF